MQTLAYLPELLKPNKNGFFQVLASFSMESGELELQKKFVAFSQYYFDLVLYGKGRAELKLRPQKI